MRNIERFAKTHDLEVRAHEHLAVVLINDEKHRVTRHSSKDYTVTVEPEGQSHTFTLPFASQTEITNWWEQKMQEKEGAQ